MRCHQGRGSFLALVLRFQLHCCFEVFKCEVVFSVLEWLLRSDFTSDYV